jgi:DNA ligase-1
VKPELVAEVAFNDLQESPRYPGGLALRFARVKSYREGKSPTEADPIQKVWQIFETSHR